jgi:hypothetical protein
MRTTAAAIIALAIITTGHAAPAPYPVTINSRAQTAPALLVYRANPATFRVSFTDGSDASVITDETPFMAWATNALATNNSPASYSVVSATNGTVDFTFSAAAVNYAAGRYVYEVGLNTGTGPKTYRQGVFTIQASTVGASVPAVSWTNAVINWGLYGYTGTASNGPVRPDGSTITASNNPDGSITLSSLAATPAWSSVTDKPTTFPPLLTATQTVIRAASSAGVTIQAMNGTNALLIGPADTANVTAFGGLGMTGALLVGGSNVMTELAGKVAKTDTNGWVVASHAGLVGTNDTPYVNLITNTATKAQGTLADTALQDASTWSQHGALQTVDFGGNAISNFTRMVFFRAGEELDVIGNWTGTNGAVSANIGNRMLYDENPSSPGIFDWSGNGAFFPQAAYRIEARDIQDNTITSNQIDSATDAAYRNTYSADREPYTIAASTNMVIDRANTDAQRIASILPGTSTIRFSAAVTNYASSIVLHVPPIGTNTIILPAGPVYSFGGGLAGLATTNYSTCFAESPVGSTNWAVTIWPGVPQ